MDFGVLDGLMSSENNKNSLISSCDLDLKSKRSRSRNGFYKQESSVSATHGDELRGLKMSKIGEDNISKTMLLQQICNGGQNMLSFSSPNTHSLTFPYYATNNTGYGAGRPFTPSQWMELEHQALIFKYITANASIPTNLLIPIKKALEAAAFSGRNFNQNTYGWGALQLGFCNSSDLEPGRCRRTNGKKWRCAKDAIVDQKYCERHMNRGRHRSRKHVELQNWHSLSNNSTVTTAAAKMSTGLRHTAAPNPAVSSQDNRKVNMEANVLYSSLVPMKKNQLSIPEEASRFVLSDSLLNPMHKSDTKPQNSLHWFMEDWPHTNDLFPMRMGLGMGKQVNRVQVGP